MPKPDRPDHIHQLIQPNMTSKTALLKDQLAWAYRVGFQPDSRGYLSGVDPNLFQPLSPRTYRALSAGSGSELRPGARRPAKMAALHSSAALAVNVFDYWSESPLGPILTSLALDPEAASLEFEAQFPTGLDGNPPNLDLAIRSATGKVVGIESKFSEWLTPKSPRKECFKAKYFPEDTALWARLGLKNAQRLATALRDGQECFRYLDAPQLLKHMLGLATNHPESCSLYYLYYDWPCRESIIHRAEVDRFRSLVGPDMPFHSSTYQAVFSRLSQILGSEHSRYTQYLSQRYFLSAVQQ